MDYNSLTVVKLRDELRRRGQSYSGLKKDLVDRLIELDSTSDMEVSTMEPVGGSVMRQASARGRKPAGRAISSRGGRAAKRSDRDLEDEASQVSEVATDAEAPSASALENTFEADKSTIAEPEFDAGEQEQLPKTPKGKTPSKASSTPAKNKTPAKQTTTPAKTLAKTPAKTPTKTPANTSAKTPAASTPPASNTSPKATHSTNTGPSSPVQSFSQADATRDLSTELEATAENMVAKNPVVTLFECIWPLVAIAITALMLMMLFPPMDSGNVFQSADQAGEYLTEFLASWINAVANLVKQH